jgi:hypothetical protein
VKLHKKENNLAPEMVGLEEVSLRVTCNMSFVKILALPFVNYVLTIQILILYCIRFA